MDDISNNEMKQTFSMASKLSKILLMLFFALLLPAGFFLGLSYSHQQIVKHIEDSSESTQDASGFTPEPVGGQGEVSQAVSQDLKNEEEGTSTAVPILPPETTLGVGEILTPNGFIFTLPQNWGIIADDSMDTEVAIVDKLESTQLGMIDCPSSAYEFYDQDVIATSSRFFIHDESKYVISYRINTYRNDHAVKKIPNVFFLSVDPIERDDSNHWNEPIASRSCAIFAESDTFSEAQVEGLKQIFNTWH
jgi:hypothetical protein